MYAEYFGLTENSFSITPDPHYLFLSQRHREALAHLLYGAGEGGGFVLLTGEVGTGKTTICRAFLEQSSEKIDIALILNPSLSVAELLLSICQEFGITKVDETHSNKALLDKLNAYLLNAHAENHRPVLLIDEAQNLKPEVLEQVRLLTNLETHKHKLLQIFLVGQPELREMLKRPDLRQLAQRITARYHLTPLDEHETQDYIQHRLAVAGAKQTLFNKGALKQVYIISKGVPRLINIICDRALLGTYALHKKVVDKKTVHKAANELNGEGALGHKNSSMGLFSGLLVVILLLVIFLWPTNNWNNVSDIKDNEQQPVIQKPVPVAIPEVIAEPVTEPIQVMPLAESWQNSMSALLDLWQINVTGRTLQSCEYLEIERVKCRMGIGTWNNLQQINHKLLLEVHNAQHQGYLVITALTHSHAIVIYQTEEIKVPIQDISPFWYGKFYFLWQPSAHGSLINAQSSRAAITWLNQHLAKAGYIIPDPNLYSTKAVIDFQKEHNLHTDGIAGQDTLIQLNNISVNTFPSLTE